MKAAPIPANEAARLAALKEYRILDAPCDEIFNNITELAANICQSPISLITLIDKDRQVIKSNFGLSATETSRDVAMCAYTILGSDIFEVENAKEDERFHDNPFVEGEPNIRFYAGSPLSTPTGLNLGSLCVVDRKPKTLTPEQKHLLTDLSKIVMTLFNLKKSISEDLLIRKQMTEKIQVANKQLELSLNEQKKNNNALMLFSQMNGMLQSSLTYEEAYAVISNFCQKIFLQSSGSLYLVSPSRDYLELVLSWNNTPFKENVFRVDDCWALRRGQYYVMSNPEIDVICPHLKNDELKTSTRICLPLNAQSEILGLLCLENAFVSPLCETKLLYAVRLAEQISLCLANIKLRLTLRHQSTIDPLTGLYNRRYLSEASSREMIRASRDQKRIGVILADIDHFKKINDTYGHDAGDLVLKKLADVLKNHVREYDLVCRLGGEEFLLFLYDISPEEIKERAEKLRLAIHNMKFKYKEQDLGQISISMGIAIFPLNGNTLEELTTTADKALYQAKTHGRNQVVIYGNSP